MAKFKLFLSVLLALTMAFTLLSTVACKDKSDDKTSSDTTETITALTDNQVIKNGDFEYGTANKKVTEYPVYSSVNWARANGSIGSSSAPSSSHTSGIIDTREYVYQYDDEGYVELDESGKPVLAKDDNGETTQLYQAIARNKSGQLPELKDENDTVIKDDKNNTVYYNPRTPSYYGLTDYTDEEGALMGGGKILMINNKNSSETGKGTAQYFSSSSEFSLYPGETGKIELWLMTKNLVNAINNNDSSWDDFGAYIEITTTIGSLSTPATRLKNIDTKGEWTKFTFYIEGSNFAQTKLALKIGLGIGSNLIFDSAVEGYAFVDDVSFTVLEKDETVPTTNFKYDLYDTDGTMNLGTDGKKTSYFERDFKKENFSILKNDVESLRATLFGEYNFLTVSDYSSKVRKANAENGYTEITSFVNCVRPGEEAVDVNANINDEQNTALYGSPLTKLDNAHNKISNYVNNGGLTFGTNTVSFGPFDNVDAYEITATQPINLSYETGSRTLKEGEYEKVSFWVKTDLTRTGGGVTLYLVDKGTGSVKPVETAISEKFVTKEDCNEDYDDWTKFTVVVSNTAKDADGNVADRDYSIKMVIGPTDVTESIYSFPIGNVSIANIQALKLTKNDELDEVSSIEKTKDTNVKEVSLSADLTSANTDEEEKDSYTFTYGEKIDSIQNGVVDEILNYVGVVGNHNRVGGDNTPMKQDGTVAGLINTEFLRDVDSEGKNIYGLDETTITAIEKLAAAALENSTNSYLQPLMINNTKAGISYGYVGNSNTIAANTTALITLKVKVIGNATANIYLVNTKNNATFNVLDVNVDRKELINNTYGSDKRFADAETNAEIINQTVNGKYELSLTATDTPSDGFTTVSFLIKTGTEAVNFRVEMWNGARRDTDTTTVANSSSEGIVIFDDFKFASSVNYENETLGLKQETDNYDGIAEQKFTRIPSKVLTDAHPENGEVRTYGDDDADTAVAYKKGTYFIVSDLSTINVEHELDEITVEEDNEDTSTDTETTEKTSYNPFLYFTSLAVSVVLIVALLAIVVKHFVGIIKKKRARSKSYYDAGLRDKANEKILGAKKEKEVKFKDEYDYNNMESNIIEEDEAEATEETEQTVEEAVEEASEIEAETVVESENEAEPEAELATEANETEEPAQEETDNQ